MNMFNTCLYEHDVFVHKQITPPKPQQIIQKIEPAVAPAELTKNAATAIPPASAPKVDFATDLFNMLSVDSPSENGSEPASNDDNGWAGFQCKLSLFTFST